MGKEMSTSNRRKLRNRQRQHQQRKMLQLESLENRILLAADFQNPIIPTDVNADMQTDTRDVLDLVSSLYRDGSRQLTINRFRSGGGGEGEGPSKFLDVNGDNFLTPRDVLDVVRYLGEGEGPQVNARMEFVSQSTGGTITSANVGDVIELNLYVQDIRNPNDPDFPDLEGDVNNLGVFSAYFDLRYPNTNTTIVNASNFDPDDDVPFGFGGDYNTLNTGGGASPFPTFSDDLIQDLGGVQTDLFGGPVGPDEFLLFTVAFRIDSAPMLEAVDDDFQVDEGASNVPLDVLANDNLGGELVFQREFADGLGKEVLTLLADQDNDDSQLVPAGEILPVDGVASISVSDAIFQGITINSTVGGTASVDDNGTAADFTDDFVRFTPNLPGTGLVVYTITDNQGGSSTATASIEVGAINDPPVNILPGNQTTNEDTDLTFNNANGNAIQTSDVDAGSAAVEMTLSVTNGTLDAPGGAGVTVSGQDTATVTLGGSIAAINAALNGGGLIYSPTADFVGNGVLTVTTDDLGNTGEGGAKSDTDQLTITVQAVNDPPVNTVPAAQTTEEDTPLTFNAANGNRISTSDIDAANGIIFAELTLSTLDGPNPGILTLGGLGGITIVGGGNNTQNVAFTGTLTNVNAALNNLVYTPPTGFFGSVELEVSVNDQGNTGSGPEGVDTDTVIIDVESTVFPRARTDRPEVEEDSMDNPINVLDNDSPNPGSDVTLLSFTQPTNGVVTLDDGGTADLTDDSLLYTPDPNFEGLDVFTYTINDTSGQGLDSTANVSVTVVGINDAPIVVDDNVSTDEDTALTIPGGDLTDNDSPGPGEETTQTLTVTAVSAASTAGGTVSVVNNVVTYSPPTDFNGTDTFTYTVTDDGTTRGVADPLMASGVVTVTVNPINDPPMAVDDMVTGEEDVQLTIPASTLTANDSNGGGDDENQQTLTITNVTSPTPGGGTVVLNGTDVIYTPGDNFNGVDTFTYTVRDNGQPNLTDTAVVTITVTEVNDAPTAGPDTAEGVQTLPTEIPVADLLANDSPGPDNPLAQFNDADQTLTVTGVSAMSDNGGTVTLNAGVVTYTPADGFSGLDTFTYTITDNGTTDGVADPLTATGTVTVDVLEFVPSTISGFVYVDGDNDGVMDPVEHGVGAATVILSGTDFQGQPVNITAHTDSTGFYEFSNLRPGDYNVTQTQPFFLLDGKDDVPGNTNDSFAVNIGSEGDVNSTENYFGERGLNPLYFTIHELQSANVNEGFWLAQNTSDNSRFWFIMYEGWDNAESGEAILSSDFSEVTLRVTDKSGTVHETTVEVNGVNPRVRLLGSGSEGRVLRIQGTAEDFGFDLQASVEAPATELMDGELQLDPLQLHELQEVMQEEMLAAAVANQAPGDAHEAAVDAAFAEQLV